MVPSLIDIMKPQTVMSKVKCQMPKIILLVAAVFLLISPFFYKVQAATGIYHTINFQGKVVNKTDGTNIADNTYSFTFKFYDNSSGGNQLPTGTPWSETQSLSVTSGIFRATLGSVTTIPSTLDFNSDSLYLDITFNGETFTTRVRMTAVPYAFNAERVNGLNVTNTTGTLTIPSGQTIAFSGANNLTLTTTGATTATLPSGTVTLVDLAASQTLTNKTIGSTGLTFSGATTSITTVSNQNFTIVPNGAGFVGIGNTSPGQMLDITGNATASGNMTMGGQLQLGRYGGDPATVGNGSMIYNSTTNTFRCYQNGAWTNCIGSGGSPVWSTLQAPTGNLSLGMTAWTNTFTWGNATGTGVNLLNLTDTTSNSGTGNLLNVTTATSSNLQPFHVSSAGIEAMLVDKNGNVGIGTTSPTGKLQVETSATVPIGKSALIVNQKENQDILSASASGIARFTVTNKDVSISGHKNNISTPGAANDIFVYDTAGDMDGGRWTQDERAINSSWYNESLGTATRGSTKPFPRKAVITATPTNVYIYDSKDNSLWMRFDQAANTALDVDLNNDPTSVFALNGKIYVGTTGSAATGMYIIDFTRDQITRFNATDARDYAADIALRNTAQTVAYANQSRTGLALVSSVVNDVRSAVVNGKTYFATATNGGTNGSVTVINETDQVLVANLGPAAIPSKQVWLTSTGILYTTIGNAASPTNYALKVRYNIPLALGNNLLFHEIYGNIGGNTNYGSTTVDNNTFASLVFTAGPAPVDATFIPNSLFVTQGTSIVDGKSNTIYIGTNDNLTIIQEKQGDTTNGLVKYYTNTYISGNLTGDIRAFYPLDTNVGSGLSDISVKGNTLTNGATAPTYNVTGVRNNGASFGASAATAFSTGASLIVPVSTPLSVAAWFKPSTLTVTNGTREVFVSADANSANVVSWGLGTKGDGTNANIYCYAGNTIPTLFEINTNIAAQVGNWYHVVLTSDSSGNLKCYVNGTLSGTGTLTGTAQTPTRFQIGATQTTTAINAVRGTVDEVQVTAETTSSALIKMSYDTGNRALNGHVTTTFRGTAVSADQRQRLNGSSSQVNTVQADLEAGRIYIGTAGGGVSQIGIQSDTINDIFTTSALDETGSAMGSNTINALSIGKGYGTNNFVAIGHGAGIWIETIDTNIKDFLSNGYNPFGSSLTQSNLNVDTVFKVTNPVTSRLDNIAGGTGTGNQPAMNDILRVDQNGTYAGLNVTLGSRTDYTQSSINPNIQAAGTLGADSGIRGATASAVFKGKLFVASRKANAAGVYRYDGGGLWTLVTAAAGKVLSGDGTIVSGYAMTVWNNQLVIGTQTTPANGLAGIYTSSNADTGTAATTTWTLLNTTQGRFNTTTAIDGVSDLAVFNGVLYLITDEPKNAEIYRYLGGTGTSVFTKTSSATRGAVCASDAGDANGGMFQIAGGRLYVGIRTSPAATARVCYYDGTSTNPDVDWKVLNSTRGAFGGYAGGASTTGMIDVTGMAVYNGELWVTAVKAANSLEIYRLKGNPEAVPAGAADFQRINQTPGRVLAGSDTTVADGAIMKAYQGRMYLGSQTGTDSLGALYEFEPSNADNFTLVNTTRGTFGSQTSVDDVTVLQPFNDPTNPNGGTVLFIGTDDAGGNMGIYSWMKYLSQSQALKMDSGNNNFGSIIFTSDDQAYDNEARSGKFIFSHAVNLSTGAFDYAEDYPTNDLSIEAGDIVAVDPQNKEYVIKGYKNIPTLGVVSENPGFRLTQSADKINGATYIPIALVGRVPVKVTTENGSIKAGDYLTASSFYGVAMKATKAGAVIGQAMEDYDGAGIGKITIYVQSGQINGAKLIDVLPGLNQDDQSLIINVNGNDFGKRVLKLLKKQQDVLAAKPETDLSEVFTDRVTAGLEVITPKVTTDTILLNSIEPVDTNIIMNLSADGTFMIKDKSVASSEAAITFDSQGNAFFAGLVTANKIKANQIEGLEIYTNKLSQLSDNIASLSANLQTNQATSGAVLGASTIQVVQPNILTLTSLNVDGIATISGDLQVNGSTLIAGVLNVIDTITSPNLIIGKWADFIGKAIFKDDVFFFGRPTFNQDTAGFAVIKKDNDRVDIVFEKEYTDNPIVNVSLTIDQIKSTDGTIQDSKSQEQTIFNQGLNYIISNRSTKGFTVVLNKKVSEDTTFSWIALSVKDPKLFGSQETINSVQAQSLPKETPIPIISPILSPTIILPSITPEASISAQ